VDDEYSWYSVGCGCYDDADDSMIQTLRQQDAYQGIVIVKDQQPVQPSQPQAEKQWQWYNNNQVKVDQKT